jgi:hypothetical protein
MRRATAVLALGILIGLLPLASLETGDRRLSDPEDSRGGGLGATPRLGPRA